MSLFLFITDINGYFEIPTPPPTRLSNLTKIPNPPPLYFDPHPPPPQFIRHLRVINYEWPKLFG